MPFTSPTTAVRAGAAALRANPIRALLATLGVVIGSAALVAVLAVGDGVERYARSRISRQGYDIVQVRPITEDTVDGQWVARADIAPLTIAELESVAGALAIGERATLSRRGVVLVELGQPKRRRALAVLGVAISAPDTLGLSLVAGRHLTPDETRRGEPVTLINDPLARALLADSGRAVQGVAAAIGDSLPLGGRWLRVVGVVAPEEGVPANRTQSLIAVAPLALAEPAFVAARGGAGTALVVTARRAEEMREMRGRVEGWLAARDPKWQTRYRVDARAQWQLDEIRRGMLIFKLLMGSFTGITLIVGGIGIMNVLLASVAERTREIGVRKAVGARRRDILMQFLAESVTITSAGSVIGTALGLGGAYAVTAIMRAQTQATIYAATTVPTLLVSASVAVLVGIAFGCYPALRAARLAPIEAIHTE